MLRDKSLIPLSHQHQRALALCVRIDRAQPISADDLAAWQIEIEQHFEQEIEIHFSAEESLIFPAARRLPELSALVEELLSDHAALRESSSRAKDRSMSATELPVFAKRLSDHIRKEERQLFERMQCLMSSEELSDLGVLLGAALQLATQETCVVPRAATMLRPRK
jgi:hemerythrin-like domain-containing protein